MTEIKLPIPSKFSKFESAGLLTKAHWRAIQQYLPSPQISPMDSRRQAAQCAPPLCLSPMAAMNFMKILENCRVAPADPPSEFSLPLTFFDRIWLRTRPTSRLFFYELSEPKIQFSQIILPKLKHSLSVTLKHYLPLAGNLTWPQDSDTPIIQFHNGDGISLTVAETQADFDHLSGDNFRDSAELHPLLPDFPSSETRTPVMTLQFTLFPSGGFSIGYVAHHAAMDGKSASMFIHSWAHICKNGDSVLPPEVTPSLDRTFVEHQAEIERLYPKGFERQMEPVSKTLATFDMEAPSDTVLGTFRLTRENVESLKKSMLAYKKEKNILKADTRISAFNITSAYVGTCLIKAKKVAAEQTYIGFSVDCRLRLEPPLPPTYFGNCILVIGGGSETEKYLAEDGLVSAVDMVGEALTSLNQGIVKVVETIAKIMSSSSPPKSFVVFTIGGSPRFELYKADFGWGTPRKVEMISIDQSGAFCLSDDRDDKGGIEIGIALEKHETEAFRSIFANGLGAP